jgi:outer membrane protein OmpA-like peptidoglycan-associated protein
MRQEVQMQGFNGLTGGTVVRPTGEFRVRSEVMNKSWSKIAVGVGLLGLSSAVLADEPKSAPVSEPAGFVSGAVVGGLAAGPFGAVIGAGIGTWLGNRVHRAGEAKVAEAQVAELMSDKNELIESNRKLGAQLASLSDAVEKARVAQSDPSTALQGLQGDVLFRTGRFDLEPVMSQQVLSLAQALAKSQGLKIRIDGYADPRGGSDDNLKLSEARANAVRDILLSAGVSEESLEVNAFGKDQSEAEVGDTDAYALERRVRLTLLPKEGAPAVAQAGENE